MSRLKVAVVGVGHLGRIHARLAAGLPELELAVVVDSRREAREAVAEATGARPVADYRELFGEVDAAIVATPTCSHYAVASELMRGGIHLLVEKPLTPTVREAAELVQIARRHQLILQVGHVERFNPALLSVEGRLQEPKYIEARRQSGYTFRSTDVGVVMDLMIHDIDVALSLVKSPLTKVDAVGVSVLGDHEDMVNARLEFANGAVANLTASRTSYQPQRTMHVFTPHEFAAIDFAARRATIVAPRADLINREFQGADLSSAERDDLVKRFFEELLVKHEAPAIESNAIEEELRDFATAIRSGKAPRVSGADGRDAVAVAEAVLEEVRRHDWDGNAGKRVGPLATPFAPAAASLTPVADWSTEDTVILRRKAG